MDSLYRELINNVISAGIEIRIFQRDPPSMRYVDFEMQGMCSRAIEICRKSNTSSVVFLGPSSKASELDSFFGGTENLEWELITLAHEFGHANSPNAAPMGPLYTKLEQGAATFCEKHTILNEELFAWGFSRGYLEKADFKCWDEFNNIQEKSISTYRNAKVNWRNTFLYFLKGLGLKIGGQNVS